MNYKSVEIDGIEQNVPDINEGDRVDILMEPREDVELYDWLMDHEGEPLIVTHVEYENSMVWLENCEYGVDMQFVVEVYEQ